jgi:hypothetical protein
LPNGLVLIVGGGEGLELYNPGTGTFTLTGGMFYDSGMTTTLLPDGLILIAGGDDGSNSAELYNPATGTVTATGAMTTGRFNQTATLLPDGLVLIVGGEYVTNNVTSALSNLTYLASAELYTP